MNKEELKLKLNNIGIPHDWYFVDDYGNDDQRLCLMKDMDKWLVYYSERGSKLRLKEFEREEDACDDLYSRLIDKLDFYNKHR